MAYTSSQLSTSFPETKDCLELEQQINKLINNVDYWRKQGNEGEGNASKSLLDIRKEQSDKNGCDKKIMQQRGDVINAIFDKYSSVDKIRIQTESIQKRNKQIIFGGAVLLIAFGMLITIKFKGK